MTEEPDADKPCHMNSMLPDLLIFAVVTILVLGLAKTVLALGTPPSR